MKKKQSHRIARIILKMRYNIATDKEKQEFEIWAKNGKERKELFNKIISDESLKDYLVLKSDYDRSIDYVKLQSDILRSLTKRNRQKQVKRYFLWCGSVAAGLLVAFMSVFWYIETLPGGAKKKMEIAKVMPVATTIQDKVILVLADGKKVGMSKLQQDSMRVGMAVAMGQEDKLVYDSDWEQADSMVSDKLEMNKVITSTGGFYSLVLSDGTRVWLNSESELEYPVFFGKGQRLVKLCGEAFFEVKKDTSRPFIVETNDIRTRVLGTSFNMKAYRNESFIATTLFSGKVEVSPLTDTLQKVVLSPGKQADWDLHARCLNVEEVNLSNIIAWKEGMFMFSKENIDVVTRQIERWYGVKFIYDTSNRKQYVFNGYLSKDESLETILKALTFTGGPKFKIDGNVVYVKE